MIGIIGGAALLQLPNAEHVKDLRLSTPFGKLNTPISLFSCHDIDIAVIPRAGAQYQWLPQEINYAGYIWALKSIGVKLLISVHESHALSSTLHVGDIVLSSDFVDLTHLRRTTFFGNGLVAKPRLEPLTNPLLNYMLVDVGHDLNIALHQDKVCAVTEGPRANTHHESKHLKQDWNAHICGQTQTPEIFLAREAQMHVCCLNLITEYDLAHPEWRPTIQIDELQQATHKMLGQLYRLINHFLQSPLIELKEELRLSLKQALFSTPNTLSQQQQLLLSVLQQ